MTYGGGGNFKCPVVDWPIMLQFFHFSPGSLKKEVCLAVFAKIYEENVRDKSKINSRLK